MSYLQKMVAVVSVVLFASSLVGCNTIRGFGRDVQRGGETVEDAADPAQEPIRRR